MKSTVASSLFLTSLLFLSSTSALRLPFQKRAPRGLVTTGPPRSGPTSHFSFLSKLSGGGDDNKEVIGNVKDVRYTTNITINGHEVTVALDTGSTDLWVLVPDMGSFNDTKVPLSLLYGDGTYGVQGTIGVSPFEFGPYKVEKQAFLSATESTIGGLTDLGINGIFGLSFEIGAASPINDKLKSIYGNDATWGKSVLQNIFDANSSQPNLISLQLGRTGDLESTGGGEFLIGEYNANFTDKVAQAAKLDQYPPNGNRWTTIMDGIWVDDVQITYDYTSSVPVAAGVPFNATNTVALLDSGDPTGIFPAAIAKAIFDRVPGAVSYVDDGTQVYIVPCNTTTDVEVSLGGVRYPFHPLDLTVISDPFKLDDGSQHIACISSFTIADGLGQDQFDLILGDTFLRNVYSVYDFGDTLPTGDLGNPYMKLVSTLDPAKAIQQVATIRGQTLASLPSELVPADLVAILTGSAATPTASNAPPLPPSTSGVTPPLPSPSDDGDNLEKGGNVLADLNNAAGNAANIFSEHWPDIKNWAYVALGLLGLNALIGIVLLVMGCMMCIRKGGKARGPPAVNTLGAGYVASTGPSNKRPASMASYASADSSNTQYAPIKQDEAFGSGYPQHHQVALPQYHPPGTQY